MAKNNPQNKERKVPAQKKRQAEKVHAKKKSSASGFEKRLKDKKTIAIGVIILLMAFGWVYMQPPKGSIYHGICRTFAELRLVYPETFKITYTEIFSGEHRIYYTYTTPYGWYNSAMISCKYKPITQEGRLDLEYVKINRDLVDQDDVDAFNMTIPIVAQHKPDLILPRHWNGTLEGLKVK